MLNPLNLLIGPALRHPQGPREGEVPGSGQPYSATVASVGAIVAVAALGWTIRAAMRRGSTATPPQG